MCGDSLYYGTTKSTSELFFSPSARNKNMAPNLLGRYNFFWPWPDGYDAFLTFFIFPIIYRRNIIFWKIFKKSMISDHMAQKYENLENDRIFKRGLLLCFIMLNDSQINMISTHWAQKRNYARFWAQYPIIGWQKFRSDQTSRIDEQQFCLTWFILSGNIHAQINKTFSSLFVQDKPNDLSKQHFREELLVDGFSFVERYVLPDEQQFCLTWFILWDNSMRKTTKPFSHFFCNINTMIHPNNVFSRTGFS